MFKITFDLFVEIKDYSRDIYTVLFSLATESFINVSKEEYNIIQNIPGTKWNIIFFIKIIFKNIFI